MAEAKVKREVLSITIPKRDALDQVLNNHPLPRVLRIGTWVWRFIHNCRAQPRNRKNGPITTDEMQRQELWWIKQAQQSAQQQANFQADKLQLNLQENDQQVLECRGRIMGEYPICQTTIPSPRSWSSKRTYLPCMEGLVSLWLRFMRNTGYPGYDA